MAKSAHANAYSKLVHAVPELCTTRQFHSSIRGLLLELPLQILWFLLMINFYKNSIIYLVDFIIHECFKWQRFQKSIATSSVFAKVFRQSFQMCGKKIVV